MRIFEVRVGSLGDAVRIAIEDAIRAHLGDVTPRRWVDQYPDAVLLIAPPPEKRAHHLWDPDTPDILAYIERRPIVVSGLPGWGLVAGRVEVEGIPVITVPDLYDAIYELGAVLEWRSQT